MGRSGSVDCSDCREIEHKGADDVSKVKLPTEETCERCHKEKHHQYAAGKRAAGWVAMSAMPKTGCQPHAYIQGLKRCGGCHNVGVRDEATRADSRCGSPCDACHTRHKFSKAEASKPEACRICHVGFDHPQWEMWSTSKHSSIYQMEGDTGRAPKCQTCHVQDGDHAVMTARGFLGLQLPEGDAERMGYRATIPKGLQVLDPDGKPTARLDVVKAGNVVRLTKEAWEAERAKMIKVCAQCQSKSYAETNPRNADQMLKDADKLMAEAIDVVADL